MKKQRLDLSLIKDWVDSAEKNKSEPKDYFEDDATEIAKKHGLVYNRPPVQKKQNQTINVNESKVQTTKKQTEEFNEGMFGDAILNSDTFKHAVTKIILGNKELLTHLISEVLKHIDIKVQPKVQP